MAITHIPVAQAALDLPRLLDRARAGEDIVIEDGASTPVRLAPESSSVPGPLISQVIEALRLDEKESRSPLRMGADFANDVEAVIEQRKPRDVSKWD